jgi:hypothetical protein
MVNQFDIRSEVSYIAALELFMEEEKLYIEELEEEFLMFEEYEAIHGLKRAIQFAEGCEYSIEVLRSEVCKSEEKLKSMID